MKKLTNRQTSEEMHEYQAQMAHSFTCLNAAFSNSLTKLLPPFPPTHHPTTLSQAHFSLCPYPHPTHPTMCLFIMLLVFPQDGMQSPSCQGFFHKLCRKSPKSLKQWLAHSRHMDAWVN